MTSCKVVLSLAVLLLVSSLALAQGTYTQVDVPGATLTQCYGIDSAGDVTGYYYTASSVSGFYLSGGNFTTINHQSQNTTLRGINDVGQIVGIGFVTGGFVYDLNTQTFTEVREPNGYSTTPISINNAGTVVGYYFMGGQRGFELANSSYTDIDPPGTRNVQLYGISSLGTVYGFADSKRTGVQFDFSYNQGTYQKIHIPNAPNALAFGVNPAGNAIVGAYAPSSGVVAGFVYQNRVVQTLQFPGSSETVATAINNAGEVAGYFFDSNRVSHGFLWTPPADAEKK